MQLYTRQQKCLESLKKRAHHINETIRHAQRQGEMSEIESMFAKAPGFIQTPAEKEKDIASVNAAEKKESEGDEKKVRCEMSCAVFSYIFFCINADVSCATSCDAFRVPFERVPKFYNHVLYNVTLQKKKEKKDKKKEKSGKDEVAYVEVNPDNPPRYLLRMGPLSKVSFIFDCLLLSLYVVFFSFFSCCLFVFLLHASESGPRRSAAIFAAHGCFVVVSFLHTIHTTP
jgi:hypothetical protein